MFTVYLAVDFIQLYIDIMQRLLNTHSFTLSSHLKRTLTTSRIWLLASLTLLLTGLAGPVAAQVNSDFWKNFIILNKNGGGNSYYYTFNQAGSNFQRFQGDLGSFDRIRGQLLLGGEANTYNINGDDVQAAQLFYRVYLEGTSPGGFAPLNLDYLSSNEDGNPANKKWGNKVSSANLLNATSGDGRYVLEIYFQGYATYNNGGSTGNRTFYDSNNSSNYRATFNVNNSGTQAQWTGRISNSWFDRDNWNGGHVPDTGTDVIIPYISGLPGNRYPEIVTNANNQVALARSIRIEGNGAQQGAALTLTSGELQVYGSFSDTYGGFKQTAGTFALVGTDQVFDGEDFYDVRIDGGGNKTLATASMIIRNKLIFVSGKLTTSLDNVNPTTYNVNLDTDGQIVNESEIGYVSGIVRSKRQVQEGSTSSFGNIGIDLTANQGSAGSTVVLRTSRIYKGAGTSVSVQRGFTFTPGSDSNLQNYDLVFHYLDVERNGISPENLALFRSKTSNIPFEPLYKTSINSDPAVKTLTRKGITSSLSSVFTLGDGTNPLPVDLISFTATPTPQGAAILRWATAKEANNKGFGIERTLDAAGTWKEVGYVATTNTPNGKSYEYTDKSLTTAPASTQAYYRLRQEDLDGKVTYSPVAAVARQAALTSTGIVLSPVPLDGPNLSVSFAEAGQAGQEVVIINTQGQRMLHFTTQNSAEGTLSLPVANLAAGVYIVRIQTPGQAVRHARFVKL
jgi:hypothetical protein